MEQISEQLQKEVEEELALDWVAAFDLVAKKYTDEIIYKLVLAEFHRLLEFIKNRRTKVYEDNDERRRKGVSFEERERLLDRSRLKYCDEYEAKLLQDVQVFKIRPLHQWFGVDEYWDARRRGMGWCIRWNFNRIYYVPNKK